MKRVLTVRAPCARWNVPSLAFHRYIIAERVALVVHRPQGPAKGVQAKSVLLWKSLGTEETGKQQEEHINDSVAH